MTPFEIFRKPVTLYRKNSGSYVNGFWVESTSFTLSAGLSIGNVIAATVNNISTGPIFYTGSSINTMNLLAAAILAVVSKLSQVIVSTDGLTLTVIPYQNNIAIINSVFLSGMNAPTATISNSTVAIPITASVQPTTGEEMLSIPEGRRNRKSYALFTSTDVEVIHNGVNPDTALIYGELYEIVQVWVWQNNPIVFGIINHYKFIAVAMEAIP